MTAATARVHVALHDVTPAFIPEIEQVLGEAEGLGLRPALLVVPDHHRRWCLLEHPAFCARLRAWQDAGHEVFLHGLYHQADAGRGLSHLFRQRVVSAGEAEFASLSDSDTAARLDEGLAIFSAVGLRAEGFVPPAWSSSRGLTAALAARNLRYTETHTAILDPTRGLRRPSLVLNFASRTRGRLVSSVAFCRLAMPFAALFPTRVAIHPADVRSARLRVEVTRLLRWAARQRVCRAAQLLDSASLSAWVPS